MEGTPFGRYRLVELRGRGGMGEVWRAYDTRTHREVAIKVLPAHFVQDQLFLQRFRREAHAAARLHNPHIIPIHDYGEIDGRLYVDMRLIEGRDLQAVLADGPLEPPAPFASSNRSPRRCTPRTRSAWCTATSSRPTPCSTRTTTPI